MNAFIHSFTLIYTVYKVADLYYILYNNNNNNKRPLTPKSMPPAGDEHCIFLFIFIYLFGLSSVVMTLAYEGAYLYSCSYYSYYGIVVPPR